jgi:hypothetical protein
MLQWCYSGVTDGAQAHARKGSVCSDVGVLSQWFDSGITVVCQ